MTHGIGHRAADWLACRACDQYADTDHPPTCARIIAMKPIFVQLQCAPGKTYDVADAIYQTELVSELYSTSGDYDLLMKVYIGEDQDIGKFINDTIANIPGIVRSLTTLTFRAFR
jgi:DNA-binding Lrp family transcriptional regulator